jgi:hypothetical protein
MKEVPKINFILGIWRWRLQKRGWKIRTFAK